MFDRSKWFFHPIAVFIFSVVALGMSLALYIYWYIEVSTGLLTLVQRFNIDSGQVLEYRTWVVIMVLSILVAIILVGIFTIFVYHQKTLQLYRLQNNFINNFTHELKTPVTSIKLYLETFLRHELLREDKIRYVEYMLKDADRLAENINRILELARIESKSYQKHFHHVDIIDFIDGFFKKNKHLFSGADIQVNISNNRSCMYHLNVPLFEMLFMNLTSNALKYNRSDHPTLIVSVTNSTGRILLQFKDNGIGIERSEAKKIFRKFYQVGRSDNMTAKGFGIGLFLVQSIVKIHKGKIWVDNNGNGSTFTIALPL